MLRFGLKNCLALALTMALSGCAIFDNGGVDVVDLPSELPPSVVRPQLRTGVKVRIAVSASGEPIIDEVLKEVSAQGEVVMPYIGVVQCLGLSIEEFQNKLTEAYKEYYREPTVTAYYVPMAEGGSSPWGSVIVQGSVLRPGVVYIPQTCDLTVTRAIQESGGVKPFANASRVRVTRCLADGTRKGCDIDVDKIGRHGRTDLDVVLMPGDVVYVPESNL